MTWFKGPWHNGKQALMRMDHRETIYVDIPHADIVLDLLNGEKMKKPPSNIRIFIDGLLPLVIMKAIQNGDDYAYTIRRTLVGHGLVLAEGAVYSCMKRMVDSGFLTADAPSNRPRDRRHYQITELGYERMATMEKEFVTMAKFIMRKR